MWLLIVYLRAEVPPAGARAAARPTGHPPVLTGRLCAVTEQTLVLIKPDGVERALIGEIVAGSSARA